MQDIILGAVFANRLVDHFGCLVHCTKCGEGVENDCHACAAQFVHRVEGGITKLGNIREDRNLHGFGKLLVHRELCHGLWKYRISPCLDAGAGPINRGLEALYGKRVGSRHDDKIRICFCISSSFNPVNHLVLAHDCFSWPVSASFRAHLVFDVHRSCARLNERFCRTSNVKCGGTEPGIDIDQ